MSFLGNDDIEDIEDVAGEELEMPLRSGRPLKAWDKLKPRQKRNESQEAFQAVKKTAVVRNVEPEKLVGGLLRR